MTFDPAVQESEDGPLCVPFRKRVEALHQRGIADKTIANLAGISAKWLYNSTRYKGKNMSTRSATRLAAAVATLEAGAAGLAPVANPAAPHIEALRALGFIVVLIDAGASMSLISALNPASPAAPEAA